MAWLYNEDKEAAMTVTTTQTPNTALRWPRGSVRKAQFASIVEDGLYHRNRQHIGNESRLEQQRVPLDVMSDE